MLKDIDGKGGVREMRDIDYRERFQKGVRDKSGRQRESSNCP